MSIASSIKNVLMPIHKEGYKFIAAFFLAAILLGLLWKPLFWLGLVLTAWCIWFFRDPERVTPVHADLVTSPADGKISFVGRVVPPAELELGDAAMLRISVFMNVFNCHINRAPVSGAISKAIYKEGKFVNAELDKASTDNERNSLVIDSEHGKIAVVQIAGLVARRILCFSRQGETLTAGQRFGLIRFGSRLDVYLPEPAEPVVSLGQTAIGGETILARFDGNVAASTIRRA